MKNDVWKVVPSPEGKSVVNSKWIYKIKHAADGSIEKHKARFVMCGFSQKEGIDYEQTFEPVERYGALEEMHIERKRTRPYSNYVSLVCDIIDKEPSNYEEATEKKEWKDSMINEYQSIMKNDVQDVVPRPKVKFVVPSKWIYKIKHAADGNIEKYKERFVARGFSQKEGIYYE